MAFIFNREVTIFLFLTWAILAGTSVYFIPLNEFGEFHLPVGIVLLSDFFSLLIIIIITAQNLRKAIILDAIEIFTLFFLLFTFLISNFHLSSWSMTEYIHYYIRNIFFYFLVGLFIYHNGKNISSKKWDIYFKIIFWIMSLISFILLSLAVLSNHPDYYLWGGKRLCGTTINHNTFGAVMVFFFYWSFFKYQKFTNIYTIVSGGLILMTGSLTAYMGVFLLLLKKPMLILIILFFSILSWFLFQEEMLKLSAIHKVYEILTNEHTNLTSLSARIDQFNWITENMFSDISTLIFGVQSVIFVRFDSEYYQIFANFGIFSLIIFIALEIISFINISKPDVKIYLIWLFSIALFLTSFLTRWNFIIFYFAVLAYGVSKNSEIISVKKNNFKN